jgi:PAS domain S-box-containing protein
MEKNSALEFFEKAVSRGEATWWEMELPSGSVIFGDAKAEMLGRDPENFKNYTDFTKLLHPEDHNNAMQAMRDHMEGKNKFYETDYRIKHKDGHYLKFYDCGQIIKKEGESITVVGFVWKLEEENEEKLEEIKKLILENEETMAHLVQSIK